MARKKTAIRCTGHETIGFTLICSEETLKKRHDKLGDPGETNFFWLRLPPHPGDIIVQTDGKSVGEAVREIKRHIDA